MEPGDQRRFWVWILGLLVVGLGAWFMLRIGMTMFQLLSQIPKGGYDLR